MDTLDPKKKKIYLGIIGFCILATVGVLYWGMGGGTSSGVPVTPPPAAQPVTPVSGEPSVGSSSANSGNVPQPAVKTQYSAPSIFPAEPTFDLAVYQDSAFTGLVDYQPLTVSPSEVGRENPFIKY